MSRRVALTRATWLLVGCLFVLAQAALPTPAAAGRYQLYSCRTPAGAPAPADGWSGSVAPGSTVGTVALDGCESGGALIAALGDEAGHISDVDRATWAFDAPSWARLTAATLYRAGYLHGGGAAEQARYEFWLAGPAEAAVFDACSPFLDCTAQGLVGMPMAEANAVAMPADAPGSALSVDVMCGTAPGRTECPHGFSDANGYAAAVFLYAADLTLEQEAGPTATNVGGELAGAATVAGTNYVSFTASDPGAGVYEAVFSIDGQVVQRSVLDEDGGRCRNVSAAGGPPAFLYVRPCPASVSADVAFETTRVANGEHHLEVRVVDAAGNEAPVLDREIDVQNPGVPGPENGIDASSAASLSVRWASTAAPRLVSAFGRGHEALGRLSAPGGAPIADADVEVLSTARAVAAASQTTNVRTDAEGRFTLPLASGVSSRTLRFLYRSRVGESAPAATATLTLSVRAGITLSISPRTTSVGHTIRFDGRLLGAPVPPDGKQLVLEARAPGGRWIEFDDVRSNPRGQFRASYRFRFAGPATYQFRALSEPESDYPFGQGVSGAVDVFEA